MIREVDEAVAAIEDAAHEVIVTQGIAGTSIRDLVRNRLTCPDAGRCLTGRVAASGRLEQRVHSDHGHVLSTPTPVVEPPVLLPVAAPSGPYSDKDPQ